MRRDAVREASVDVGGEGSVGGLRIRERAWWGKHDGGLGEDYEVFPTSSEGGRSFSLGGKKADYR